MLRVNRMGKGGVASTVAMNSFDVMLPAHADAAAFRPKVSPHTSIFPHMEGL